MLWNIELIRFLLCVLIVTLHLFHGAGFLLSAPPTDPTYKFLFDGTNNGANVIVECFFLMSGFFLAQSLRKGRTFDRFLVGKIARLWPALAFSTLIAMWCVSTPNFSWQRVILDLSFMQANGISLEVPGYNWYVSSLFWALLFYYGLTRSVSNTARRNFAIGLVTYFSYAVLVNYGSGVFGRNAAYKYLSLAECRAVAGVGLGYLVAEAMDYFRNGRLRIGRLASTVLCSTLEIAALAVLTGYFLFSWGELYKNHCIVVIVFTILLACFAANKGVVSKVLNNKFLGFAGKYAYSVYVMQQVSFALLRSTLWKNKEFLKTHSAMSTIISLLVVCAVGILTYYIVERPMANLIEKTLKPAEKSKSGDNCHNEENERHGN